MSVLFLFSFIIFKLIIKDVKNNQRKRYLKKHGIETQGEITDVYTRGGNGSPLINIFITVRFHNTDGQIYEGRSRDVIRAEELAMYRVGNTIKLTYEKEQPENFALHMHKSIFN
ncbi:DUF3592 domain-containing protein [Pantoea dispersa]|nr:DUF3592 domain-containing protein [Pantoea dispersa]MDI9768952.1 DUF3592 domain-containing protein [Pantoea dispersa]